MSPSAEGTTPPAAHPSRTGGNDAVAFTSGAAGAPFSAGVVHAWLAADRERPLVATGISTGTIAAAAMRRVYQELEHGLDLAHADPDFPDPQDLEVNRWRWFQRYHQAIVDKPFDPIWRALPDPVDFFAETPPVKDPAVLNDFGNSSGYAHLLQSSEQARRHFYLLVRLGGWLGTLPTRVSSVATTLVLYIRNKEGYGRSPGSVFALSVQGLILLAGLWTHLVFSWKSVDESRFQIDSTTPQTAPTQTFEPQDRRPTGKRPLFGTRIYLLVLLLPAALVVVPALAVFLLIRGLQLLLPALPLGPKWPWVVAGTVLLLILISRAVLRKLFPPYTMQKKGTAEKRTSLGSWLIGEVTSNLGIARGLLHPFQLQRALFNLFIKDAPEYVRSGPAPDSVKALVVCAALQETDQISLRETCRVVDALTAALSVPGLLPPHKVAVADVNPVGTLPPMTGFYDVVDGAAVRNNPIPAFFTWCKTAPPDLIHRLQRPEHTECSLHVIYSVPTGFEGSIATAPPIGCPDIVDSAFIALRLARRRDTRQEVRQANTLSRLESIRRKVSPAHAPHTAPAPEPATRPGGNGILTIFADEIAPRTDIEFGNSLAPDSDKLRTIVADGCRGSLETLYHEQIRILGLSIVPTSPNPGSPSPGSANPGSQFPASQVPGTPTPGNPVPCAALLTRIAPRRAHALPPQPTRTHVLAPFQPGTEQSGRTPGLPAVCGHCPQLLQYRKPTAPDAPQQGIVQSYGFPGKPSPQQLKDQFPRLGEPVPKVTFLGSGGVFRGAFHIGVIAAMGQVQLYPDLVVGASVGTLMGGALCRMTAGPEANAPKVIADLTALFLHVDERVSLTAILKGATKQLGIRARAIRLSPAELARSIRAGSQANSGFAATGAPPELTDALSSLLTIPHAKTIHITAEFVAGHFSGAISAFLKQIRQEALPAFDIQNCIMGVSLLEVEARRLLQFSQDGQELTRVQPYLGKTPSGRQVAFFGTTSFLNASTSFLLGRDFLSTGPSWRTVEQGLCSSAFPAVFASRPESDLLPGVGRSDRFFADGGMFDNLPFFPAFEVLADVQSSHQPTLPLAPFQATLRARSLNRNIIVCAGLNPKPDRDLAFSADTLFSVRDRAQKLSYESKTNTFLSSVSKSNQVFEQIVACDLNPLAEDDRNFLNRYVPSEIVNITPTDAAHINGTFAFCKTLNMEPQRIQASIGDGCFQTLTQLTGASVASPILAPQQRLVSAITPPAPAKPVTPTNLCPYFHINAAAFACPFAQPANLDVQGVYTACSRDPAHR